MTPKPKIGLTIGKFAPLHLGHVDMIEFALEIVDVLYIVVYHSPDKTSVPMPERATWIRELFPCERVIVIEGWNAPNRHEDLPEVRCMQEKYLGDVMSGVTLSHFISSEDYGEHLAAYLKAENVVYDKERTRRHISSTMIRTRYKQHSHMVPYIVKKRIQSDPKINREAYETVS